MKVSELKINGHYTWSIDYGNRVVMTVFPDAKGTVEHKCLSFRLFKIGELFDSIDIIRVNVGNRKRFMEFFRI